MKKILEIPWCKALELPLGIVAGMLLATLASPKLYFGQLIVESPILVGSIFIGLWAVRFIYYSYFKKSSDENKE